MTRLCLPVCVVAALLASACGSTETVSQPVGPTSVASVSGPPSGLVVTGRTSFAEVGDMSALTATATWANRTTRDVTSQVRWNSRDPSVATISPDGLLTAVAMGATTV
jgi:uncharacterized protein YjdB